MIGSREIIERKKNGGEENGEKMAFFLVWMREEKWEKRKVRWKENEEKSGLSYKFTTLSV